METWGAHDAEHEADAAGAHASDEDGDRADGGVDGHGDDDHMRDDGSGSDGGGDKLGTGGSKPADESVTRKSKGGDAKGSGSEKEEDREEGTGVGGSGSGNEAAKEESKGEGSADADGGGSDGGAGEAKRSRQHDTDAKFGKRTEEYIETDNMEDSDDAPSEDGVGSPAADGSDGGRTNDGDGHDAGGHHSDCDAGTDGNGDGSDRSVPGRNSHASRSCSGHDGSVGEKADVHETDEQFGEFEDEDVYVVDQGDSDVDPVEAYEEADFDAAAGAGDGSRGGGSDGGGRGSSSGGRSGGASDPDHPAHTDGVGGDSGGGGGGGSGRNGGDSDSPGGNGSSPNGDGDRPRTQSSGSDEVRAAPQLQDEARKEHRRKKRDSRAFALWRRLYRRRWLRQYVENGTLVREGSTRVIGTDELFMDLIVVSCTSAVGQVLRKAPNPGYRDVEKFALLFASVWGVWRDAGWLWNMFSSCGDLTEKLVVYLAMAALCGVGVSAPLAFTSDEAARGVGFSAFASSVFLGLSFVLYGWHEPILNHRSNLWNYATGYGLCIILTAIPYLLAGAVGSPNVRRALFWVAIGTVQSRLVWYPVLFRQVHKLYHRDPTLPSVNVESLAEKAQLLTLIVLGESMLVLLLEGAAVLSDGADLGRIMIILALGTLITYSYHSVYFDLDKPVLPQGHHALRYKVWTGMAWILGHLLYHMSLVLAAASLGWVVRGAALRTADGEADPFLRSERIIFSCSWAAVYCLSAGLSALHDGGPRAVTKLPRLVTRVVLATTLAVVLPLKRDRLSALDVLIITTCISGIIVIVEVVLNETDRLRWWVKVPAELKKKAEDAQRGSDASGEEGVGHAGNTDAGTESGSSSSGGSSDEEEDVEKGKPRRGRCFGEDGCWSWRRRVTPPLGSVSVRSEAAPPGVGSSGVSADSLDAPARSRARVSRRRHSFDRREERRRQRQYEKADQAGGFSLAFVG